MSGAKNFCCSEAGIFQHPWPELTEVFLLSRSPGLLVSGNRSARGEFRLALVQKCADSFAEFCAGGDISGFSAAGGDAPAYVAALARRAHDSITILARMQKPVLALVNGPAAGFGMSLALVGDLVLAARSANFTTAYGGIGLTPDGGMSWVLPRLVGLRRAQDMLLGNRRVGSEEAERIGLITRLVEDEVLAAEGAMLAAQLAAKPVAAFSAARALLLASYGSSLEDQLDREAATIGLAAAGPEFREGIGAFLAKRKQDFSGI